MDVAKMSFSESGWMFIQSPSGHVLEASKSKNDSLPSLTIQKKYTGKWKVEGMKLSNQAGITLNGNWEIPDGGTTGTIRNKNSGDNGYLSTNDNTTAGDTVIEEALDANDVGQQWKRSADDELGHFTLMNLNSEKILHGHGADTSNKLTMEEQKGDTGNFTNQLWKWREDGKLENKAVGLNWQNGANVWRRDGCHHFIDEKTNKYLSILLDNKHFETGARVALDETFTAKMCASNQRWFFEHLDQTFYIILKDWSLTLKEKMIGSLMRDLDF